MEKITISIKNCKNIKNGDITISKNKLNVKYGNNGTGKSTIAEAIKYYIEGNVNSLNSLKSYDTNLKPIIQIDTDIKNVEVFNEDFIRNIVFNKNEAIRDSFNIFVRTPEFDAKRSEIDDSLRGFKVDILENSEIKTMLDVFSLIINKITFNKDGTITKKGMGKDIANDITVYNLPKELNKYQGFFHDDKRVDWVGWKSDGKKFDDKGICPFCAEKLNNEAYQKEKGIFEGSYNKTMVKNQKDLEDYLISLESYINDIDFKRISGYTRKLDNKDDFNSEFKRFCDEVGDVHRKIIKVTSFDTNNIKPEELDKLEDKIKEFIIEPSFFKIFNNQKSMKIYDLINNKISLILEKIETLKKDFEKINLHIQNAIQESEGDINNFLRLANINYRFELNPTGELSSLAELKYCCPSENLYSVSNIDGSLSWGEKNSIALILFMYYALQKDADLIILDDPVSSFDKDKKFAILNRLFIIDKLEKTFKGKTVLLLTHDLEPVIDLRTKYSFKNGQGIGWYLTNENGELKEKEIDAENDIVSAIIMYKNDFMDKSLDIIHRAIALRKYLEYTEKNCMYENIPYNILSSLLKGRPRSEVNILDNGIIEDPEFNRGCIEIQTYLDYPEFNYGYLVENEFSREKIMEKYEDETNNYRKIQLFRAYYDGGRKDGRKINKKNPVIKKFVDESYHIENDYTHCLDYRKFDIVPHTTMEEVNDLMNDFIMNSTSTSQ